MNDKKKIITISREFGSGGRLIGRRLAEKMDVPYYDKELLDRIAEESGFCKEMMEDAEKKAKNSFLYSLISAMGTAEAGPESLSLNERFFLAQFDTIRKIADEGSCVIVGRCADYILRQYPRCYNVFIHAPLEDRIERIISRSQGMTRKEAIELAEKKNKLRASYYNFYTDKGWGVASSYDLSIDSSILGSEETAIFIRDFIQKKDGLPKWEKKK